MYCKCPNCKYENQFKTDAATRIEFEIKNGKTKTFDCVNCGRNYTLSVNKLFAKESKLILLISGIIFLVGTIAAFYYVNQMITEKKTVIGIAVVASVLLIPVWVFGILNKEEQTRVRTFNQTYVRE